MIQVELKDAYFTDTLNKQSIILLMDKYQEIKTPCIGICKYNKSNYCVGCKRHSDEITNWINYSEQMRNAIMQDLKDRKID